MQTQSIKSFTYWACVAFLSLITRALGPTAWQECLAYAGQDAGGSTDTDLDVSASRPTVVMTTINVSINIWKKEENKGGGGVFNILMEGNLCSVQVLRLEESQTTLHTIE